MRSFKTILWTILSMTAAVAWAGNGPTYVSEPVAPTISPAVRDLPPLEDLWTPFGPEAARRQDYGFAGPDQQGKPFDNPLVDLQSRAPAPDPPSLLAFGTPILNIAGYQSGSHPPDTTGEVGPNHFLQAANSSGDSIVRIFDKAGTQLAHFEIDTLSSTAPCNSGYCDPIVNYDEAADRWVISEFAGSGSYFCVYVSTSPDPTDTWYAYTFSAGYSSVPDYPKYGVWPLDTNGDGQYMEGSYFIGVNAGASGYRDVWALDRAKMLQGQAATTQKFSASDLSGWGFQLFLPVGHEGDAMPPSGNQPGLFLRPVDTEIHTGYTCSGCDLIELWGLTVDWATPANSSFTRLPDIQIADYDHTLCGTSEWACMPQQGTTQKLDPIREPAHFPLQYRNWGSYQTIVGCYGVDINGTDQAGAHWFELRKTGAGNWTLHQEGVVSGGTYHRSVCSAAMDSSGNIAIGYTRTSSTSYPSIYYSGRLATDGAGIMPYFDNLIMNGTNYWSGDERWGDYAGIGVDPSDDCTFWFTTEYGGSGQTRIAAFKFDECGCLSVPPAPVASISVPGDNRIDVSWNDSPFASITRYWVYRSTSAGGPYTELATVSDTSPGVANGPGYTYSDTTVSAGIRYYYIVKSNDGAACTSPASNEVNALATGECLLPPSFAGLSTVTNPATASCTLNLAWSAGSSNCSGAVTYSIYRSTISGFTPGVSNRIASGVTATSYSDTGTLVSGTTYYYIVRAMDAGNSVEEVNLVERSGAPTGPLSTSDMTETFEAAGGFDNAGWTHQFLSGSMDWAWSTDQSQGGTHSWFAAEQITVSDKVLVTPSFGVISSTTLTFYHRFAFEGTTSSCYDAGTLEYALAPDFSTWTVVPDAYFTANGFNGTVSTSYSNPLGGKRAWCGDLTTWTQVALNLSGLNGQVVKLRWHEGDDSSAGDTGWYVDTVFLNDAGTASTCTTGGTCTAPGAPTLNSAAGDCAGVDLAWSAGTGTTLAYNIYRAIASGGPYAKLAGMPVTGTTYTDTTAVAGTTYYYVVRGTCDAGGVTESPNSNERSAVRTAVPAAPGGVAAEGSCTGVSVSWNTVTGATSYTVLRGTICGTVLNSFTGATSPYTDTTAVAGITYNYWVVAVNTCGNSSNSACATGTRSLPTPAAPTALAATGTCAGVDLTWTASTGATTYEVWRTTNSNCTNGAALIGSPAGTTASDGTAVAGTTYYYTVKAVNACGTSALSNCANAARLTVPAAPTGVTATSDRCDGVQVSWNAAAGATGYNVLRGTVCGTALSTFSGVTSPYNDTSAVAGTAYQYWVVAVNACGDGAASACAAGTRLASPVPTISGANTNACPSESVLLTTEGGQSNYQWYLDGLPVPGASNTYTATATGSYTVSYTASNGCSGTSAAHAVTITACWVNIVYSADGPWTQVAGMGNDDAVVDPGESWDVTVTLANTGNSPATAVQAALTGTGATFCVGTAAYGAIAPGGTATGIFRFYTGTAFPCGGDLDLNVVNKISAEGTYADENAAFTHQIGNPVGGTTTYISDKVPMAITDRATIYSTVDVPDTATITDVNVTLTNITHTYDDDLDIYILHPDGTAVMLTTDNGGSGENFTNTVFDDEAATAITAGTAPFTGSFRPEGPLTALDGKPANGSWTLRIYDDSNQDEGTLVGWSITITTAGGACNTWTGGNCGGAAPGEVDATTTKFSDTTTLDWEAVAGATGYYVYRGILEDLPELLLNNPDDSCRADVAAATTWDISGHTPPAPGNLYWYLITAYNASGEGTAGYASGPTERLLNFGSACP